MRTSIVFAAVLAGMISAPASAQRIAEFSPGPNDALNQVFSGIWGWAQWTRDPIVTLRVVAPKTLWRQAAEASPAAAYALAGYRDNGDAVLVPLPADAGGMDFCQQRLATPAAVLQQVDGTPPELHAMTPMRGNERYRVILRADTTARTPSSIRLETLWFMVPYPVAQVGELVVDLDPDAMHWVPATSRGIPSPVMRVTQISGWQGSPPG